MNLQHAFSIWRPWVDRRTHERLKLPGIYAIAISDENLSGQPFDWAPHIVYFGMTNSLGGLAQRLKQFDSAINGGPGHGGAMRFLPQYPAGSDTLLHRLYVAVWPFDCDVRSIEPANLLKMGEVLYAEFYCFAEFSKRFSRLPQFNDKKASPKIKLPSATKGGG
ncbi:MAG: hypothetical protein J0I65_27050 [Variovorax sp.]|nr:hypothetical protein [Variovorax sp.]